MLVHIREASTNHDYDDWDFDNSKFVAAYDIESYDKFVKFIETLKENEKDLFIGKEWYTILDYAFSFPESKDSLPALYVYVSSY